MTIFPLVAGSFRDTVLLAVPHFWAIAWIAHKDYSAAGFKCCPPTGPTKYSAIQAIIYSLLLVPVGVLPYFVGGEDGGMSGM